MIFKSLLVPAIAAFNLVAAEQQTVTVTNTHYVSNPCLANAANSLLPNNPSNLQQGIPLVIVQKPVIKTLTSTQTKSVFIGVNGRPIVQTSQTPETAVSSDECTTYTTTSFLTHSYASTVCQNNDCETQIYTTVIPQTYTTSSIISQNSQIAGQDLTSTQGSVNAKTESNNQSARESVSKEASTIVSSSSGQILSSINADSSSKASSSESRLGISSGIASVATAETTTSTIFNITTTPSVISTPSQTIDIITTTKSNPVTEQSVVSESKSVTIDVSSITDDVTISSTQAIAVSNATINSTTLSSTSTIAPVSSFSSVYLTTLSSVYVNTYYSNSSIGFASSTKIEVESVTLSQSSYESSASDLSSFRSSATSSSSSLSSDSSSSSSLEASLAAVPTIAAYSGSIFNTIDTSSPPSVFSRQALPLGIPSGVNNNGEPIGTNKFYANLFLSDQNMMVYTWPYGTFWTKNNFAGYSAQHVNVDQRVFGSDHTNNPGVPSYYFNPTNLEEIVFSATTFTKSNIQLGLSKMEAMSALVTLSTDSNDELNNLQIPLVQGMGFITGVYNGDLIPLLNSVYGFQSLTIETSDALESNVIKYKATLSNDAEWLIYITLPSSEIDFELTLDSYTGLKGSQSVDGLIIQVAIAPSDDTLEKYYDAAAGMYVTDANVQGTVANSAASYSFVYDTTGKSSSGSPIIFALPHHLKSLTSISSSTGIEVPSQTKGNMAAFLSNTLSFNDVIEDISFLPSVTNLTYSKDQLTLLAEVANEELAVNIPNTVKNMNSNYFSGKVLDKYANILLVVSEIIQDEDVTRETLNSLKEAFETFTNNEQFYPLMYDTKFGGVTSTSAQNGDTGADYGSAYYNDHHFHYGYFVHAAAVVGYVDKKFNGTWAEDNKDWVNSLVRDVANPSKSDSYFPVSRMFDWYQGHSWAAGVFASNDGKNQESSSEDINFAYGMKLWGNVIGDGSMESRGGLMLSIMRKSFEDYFYFKSDNSVQPSSILPNKVSGIFFENKVAYTTYFGAPDEHPSYVHGIHMLPISPASAYVRTSAYTQEEWDDQISTFISGVSDGWLGILRLDEAIHDPQSSYDFFSSSSFSNNYLDNGQSRTWSLAFSGALLN